MSVDTRRVVVARGSPVPVLRAKRGNAPPLTCNGACARAQTGRRWLSARSRFLGGSTAEPEDAVRDVLRPSFGVDVAESCEDVRAAGTGPQVQAWPGTGPSTSSGACSGSLVKTRTSGRASSAPLSWGPASGDVSWPPTEGVGSAGSYRNDEDPVRWRASAPSSPLPFRYHAWLASCGGQACRSRHCAVPPTRTAPAARRLVGAAVTC